ncbi:MULTISPECIES: hypothetical protein [Streptomyces]|uniref:hypothetical protein n=1 Tax=Streptomyces TaxID=1883 RepID=UPI001A8FDA6C|nr:MULTISPECIES: hypothetical protein [Streptomyces]MDW4901350.1 hypothetical protein [Streptomyces californicus]QSS95479.1 hypothetical protein H3V39_34035 [Streptomyces sp. M54]
MSEPLNRTTNPLADVAASPEATARYLADIQRVLLDIGKNLESLALETRVHCRDTHVEGDRFYDAWMRAQPVERALRDVLKHVEGVTKGLERSAYKRRAHDENVTAVEKKRKEKALEKSRKKNPPQLNTAPGNAAPGNTGQQVPQQEDMRYGNPTSIYDLRNDRRSA